MHHLQVGIPPFQAVDALLATVRRPIVHDYEHPSGAFVRLLLHHLSHHSVERLDADTLHALAEHLATMHVPARYVLPRPTAFIPPFHQCRSSLLAWHRLV